MTQRVAVDEAAFIYDWEAGITLLAMAVKYGISDSTVSKVAARMGLAPRRSRWPDRTTSNAIYALTGGEWVPSGGVMVWRPNARV